MSDLEWNFNASKDFKTWVWKGAGNVQANFRRFLFSAGVEGPNLYLRGLKMNVLNELAQIVDAKEKADKYKAVLDQIIDSGDESSCKEFIDHGGFEHYLGLLQSFNRK